MASYADATKEGRQHFWDGAVPWMAGCMKTVKRKGPHSPHCHCLVTQSCLTFWDPMDCRLSGSSVPGIFQERVLEWVAILFSRGSFQPGIEPGSPALQADSLPSEPPGNPKFGGSFFSNNKGTWLLSDITLTWKLWTRNGTFLFISQNHFIWCALLPC